MLTVNVNTNTLTYDDYMIVRNAKYGDIVELSDGLKYRVEDSSTRFSSSGYHDYSDIAYGGNDTEDNR